LEFRWEMYKFRTQFRGLDTGARFDAEGRQVNARLGQFTSAGSPRMIQFALRLSF
jgi:hypothetical protein